MPYLLFHTHHRTHFHSRKEVHNKHKKKTERATKQSRGESHTHRAIQARSPFNCRVSNRNSHLLGNGAIKEEREMGERRERGMGRCVGERAQQLPVAAVLDNVASLTFLRSDFNPLIIQPINWHRGCFYIYPMAGTIQKEGMLIIHRVSELSLFRLNSAFHGICLVLLLFFFLTSLHFSQRNTHTHYRALCWHFRLLCFRGHLYCVLCFALCFLRTHTLARVVHKPTDCC